MSDVISAAVIAGSVGLAGNVTTYLVARRGSKTAIATADRAAQVELAKVEAERDRLLTESREAERSNRQGTYHRALATLDRLDMYGTGPLPVGEEALSAALEEFNAMVGGIHLFGADAVREALGPLTQELSELGEEVVSAQAAESDLSYIAAYRRVYRSRQREIVASTGHLIEAMRADVTEGIHTK